MEHIVYITEENVSLLQNGKKNFVFGAGDYGKNSLKFLREHGVAIEGVLLDEAYISSGEAEVLAHENIVPFHAVPKNSNFIFAISSIARWQKLQTEYPGLVAFSVYDPWGFLQHGTSSLQDIPLARISDLLADEESKETLENYVYKRVHKKAPKNERLCQETIYFNTLTQQAKHREGAFINAGAHHGETTDAYLRFVGDGDSVVYNFEPDADNYRVLSEKYQGRKQIHSIQAGLWDQVGTVSF